ncbi:ATP-binding protein [uncultured Desulfobacter sp.]|uniref:ATP-binding protein n=1 Tax=uncultured Desulfobacter sp. TaxID=240139 RepID=UPI002AABD8B5|nr:ATP-binding protein [uncultured Desulfobacter sp.]
MKRIFFSFFLFIMISMIGLQYAQPLLIGKPMQEFYRQEYLVYWRNLTQGTFHLLLRELQPLAPAQQELRLQQLHNHFGYPISLVAADHLVLSAAERQQLNRHLIVVTNNGSLFYRIIPGTDRVITMGPILDFDISLQVHLLSWALITLLFGLMAMLWARPFWSKLRKISNAAQAFGQGDFSARAQLPQRSALAPLAGTFNDMAGRIQQLIGSHKELTRAVSHELRTPISRIRFGLEMAQSSTQELERQNYIADIGRDVDELDELVSELLVYARFDREAPKLHQEQLVLAPWLLETIRETAAALTRTTVTCLIAEQAESVRALVAPRYLGRAVSNLIINADKYAKRKIVVRLEFQEERCLIHIDDDGPGIPCADRERIFKPFVRLDGSRAKETGGHGLGLAIVKQVISLHGGTVWTEPSPLGGARFTLCW